MGNGSLAGLAAEYGVPAARLAGVKKHFTGFLHPQLGGCYIIDVLPCFLSLACGAAVPDWEALKGRLTAHCLGSQEPVDAVDALQIPAFPPALLPRGPDLESEVRRLKRQVVVATQKGQRWKTSCLDARTKLETVQKELEELQAAGKAGPTKRYLSISGGLTMALKRNLGNAPCAALGLLIGTDIHHSNVSIWEQKLEACLRLSTQTYYTELQDHLSKQGGVAIHAIRSDSTNGKIWHERKLHLAEFRSEYILSENEDGRVAASDPSLLQSSALGDVAIVPDGSGNTCRGMLQHQAGSVGCPGWAAEVQRLGEAPTVDDAGRNLPTLYGRLQHQHVVDKRRADAPPRQVAAYIQCTDAGSEQLFSRRLICRETMPCLYVWHLDGNCFQHQQHLAFKRGLEVSEYVLSTRFGSPTKCDSSLAKTCNVWRTHGKNIYMHWVAEFGSVETLHATKTLPRRCLTGRWGSQYDCEEKVLSVNRDHLLLVLKKSVAIESKPRRRQGGMHALGDEEAEEYFAKTTKWNADVLAAVADTAWHFTMRLSHRARRPLRHFYLSLQKHAELKDDSMDQDNVGYMAHLVWGRADAPALEFSALLRHERWSDLLNDAYDYITVQQAHRADSAIVALVLNGAA